jgi:hypothetical protein
MDTRNWTAIILSMTDLMAMLPFGWIRLAAMLQQGQAHTLAK